MTIVPRLWQRLNFLVPSPECSTYGDDYDTVQWGDGRAKPSVAALLAITDQELAAATEEASAFAVTRKAIIADLDITYAFVKNMDLFNTPAEFKQAVLDRYKILNGS